MLCQSLPSGFADSTVEDELVDDAEIIGTVYFAALQGIAVMANNRTIDPLRDELIVEVVDSLLHGLAPRTR